MEKVKDHMGYNAIGWKIIENRDSFVLHGFCPIVSSSKSTRQKARWHDFENERQSQALKEWCSDNEIELVG